MRRVRSTLGRCATTAAVVASRGPAATVPTCPRVGPCCPWGVGTTGSE